MEPCPKFLAGGGCPIPHPEHGAGSGAGVLIAEISVVVKILRQPRLVLTGKVGVRVEHGEGIAVGKGDLGRTRSERRSAHLRDGRVSAPDHAHIAQRGERVVHRLVRGIAYEAEVRGEIGKIARKQLAQRGTDDLHLSECLAGNTDDVGVAREQAAH